jgi:hypothetical protein
MAAGYQEIFLEQGTDFNTTITLSDGNGDLFVLTGCVAKSTIKKSYYSSNATAQLTVSIDTPTPGSILLSLNSANTANISPGRYVYDVMLKDSANNVSRVLEGIVNVLPRVTVF